MDSHKYSGYIGLGDCYRVKLDYVNAIKYYSIVIDQEEHLLEVIGLKRVVCYVEQRQFELATNDVERVGYSNNRSWK